MRNLLTIVAIIFCFNAGAQTIKGDTLFVDKPVKFINIQGRIYEVQAPTLKEVDPRGWQSLLPVGTWRGGSTSGVSQITPTFFRDTLILHSYPGITTRNLGDSTITHFMGNAIKNNRHL